MTLPATYLACLWLAPAAGEPASHLDTLAAAWQAYDEFAYERALAFLEPVLVDAAARPVDHARAYLYRGLVRYSQGDRVGADSDFLAAFAADPGLTPPAGVSPRVLPLLEAAKAKAEPAPAVAPPATATLAIAAPAARVEPPAPWVSPPPVETRSRLSTSKIVGFGLLGLGAVALVGGGGLLVRAAGTQSKAKQEHWADAAHRLSARSQTQRGWGVGLLTLAGVSAVSGTLVLVVADNDAPLSR